MDEEPQNFCDATIINVFKKVNTADYGDYRGQSLLEVGTKFSPEWHRLLPKIQKILLESQSGFRPNRGTSDLIFSLQQLQEKAREQQTKIYAAFLDLSKAFDSHNRKALWDIMHKFDIPRKFIAICKSVHENNLEKVLYNGQLTDLIKTEIRVPSTRASAYAF